MGEQPVIAEVDAEQPAQMGEQHGEDQAAPAEPAGHEGQQRQGMVAGDADDVGPVELKRPHAGGQRQPVLGGERGGMIRGGQKCRLDGRSLNGCHGGGGSHLCARPSSAEQPDSRYRVRITAPLQTFDRICEFFLAGESGSDRAGIGRGQPDWPVWIDIRPLDGLETAPSRAVWPLAGKISFCHFRPVETRPFKASGLSHEGP